MDEKLLSPIPVVDIYGAIRPEETGAIPLEYPNLVPEIVTQQQYVGDRWELFEDTPADSLECEIRSRSLAVFYLLKTVDKYVEAGSADSRKLWAQRFTEACIELYDQPDPVEVRSMLAEDIKYFSSTDNLTAQAVVDVYEPLAGYETGVSPELTQEIIDEYKDMFEEMHADVFALVDNLDPGTHVTPAVAYDVFSQALELLRVDEPQKWDGWTVEMRKQKNHQVRDSQKVIIVGENHANEDVAGLRSVLAHEILAHAVRYANAASQKNRQLHEKQPGYINFDEGLGIWNGFIASGAMSDTVRDRYIDIAFALGSVGDKMTRPEIFELAYNRKASRLDALGKKFDERKLAVDTWTYVDRIFRGTPGADNAEEQGVFTKDIAYYVGFKKVVSFISSERAKGKTMREIYDYMMQAMFDPTDERHRELVDSHGRRL